MGDNFRAHRRELGGRLEELQGLGRRGGLRFVDNGDAGVLARVLKEVVPVQASSSPLSKAPDVSARRSGPKVGRPKASGVRPWEAEGISRAEYFRRKKAGRL